MSDTTETVLNPEQNPGKRVKVNSVFELKPGAEGILTDFQISAAGPDGVIRMADLSILDEDTSGMVEYRLQPGAWRITPKSGMQRLELPDETYIETEASRTLSKHFTTFFGKLHVYRKYKLPPTRKLLFGSDPGMGKSAMIRSFCRKVKDEDGMCILRIDTADISWELMTQMFMKAKVEDVKRVVLVIEDIGGTALDQRNHYIQPDLLNFMSGNNEVFKVPTLVIATTNYLDELGPVLTDRPDRFDVVKQLNDLSDEDTTTIVSSLLGREMVDEEKKALLGKKFTPAYCKEAIVRAELHETTIEEAVNELIEQRKRSQGKSHAVDGSSTVGFAAFDD